VRPRGVHAHGVSIVARVTSPTAPGPWHRVAAVCAIVLCTAACAGSPPEVPAGPDGEPDPVLALGRDVYGEHCSRCHGTSGGGGAGDPLVGVAERIPDPVEQAAVIREGRDGMPSFQGTLSDAEIDAVVRYTREILS
jgi:mono/diheme cytochrome c family protein